jgi:hypothetical protein
LLAEKVDCRFDVGEMGGVGHDGFDRNVVGQDFVVGVENGSALGEDWLLDDVFLSREARVLIVLDHLKIDQAKRKEAEKKNEAEADDCASCSAVPFHLEFRGFETG